MNCETQGAIENTEEGVLELRTLLDWSHTEITLQK